MFPDTRQNFQNKTVSGFFFLLFFFETVIGRQVTTSGANDLAEKQLKLQQMRILDMGLALTGRLLGFLM